YGETFTVPDAYIPKAGARLMSLQDPTKKMSKSDENVNGCVFILDDKDTILRKFKRAVTDSDTEVCYREGKDGINNLMTIYSTVTGKTLEEIEKEFAGKGYGDFKTAVGEAVADHLSPVQTEYARLSADKTYLTQCFTRGAEQAYKLTRKTLQKVYRKVGFIDRL
ncbi:MAG: tryptophan--tRNA ligase, partial [Oscillospiraceae bacterium]|nr:tryptophan--tRNA ligase [Oscillospiraceae bacterium]